MNKYLEHLIEDPHVYYIYQRGSSIYGLNTKESDIDYLVIISPEYKLPEEFKEYQVKTKYQNDRDNIVYDNSDFIFLYIEHWFDKVMKNDIQAWECVCLNKKFIKKEYVKLILKTDIIQLIKNLIKQVPFLAHKAENQKEIWYFIKDVLFTQQIIENHKIIDFKEANKYRDILNLSVQECLDFGMNIWKQFYNKNKSQYEYYIKSIKQNE